MADAHRRARGSRPLGDEDDGGVRQSAARRRNGHGNPVRWARATAFQRGRRDGVQRLERRPAWRPACRAWRAPSCARPSTPARASSRAAARSSAAFAGAVSATSRVRASRPGAMRTSPRRPAGRGCARAPCGRAAARPASSVMRIGPCARQRAQQRKLRDAQPGGRHRVVVELRQRARSAAQAAADAGGRDGRVGELRHRGQQGIACICAQLGVYAHFRGFTTACLDELRSVKRAHEGSVSIVRCSTVGADLNASARISNASGRSVTNTCANSAPSSACRSSFLVKPVL